MFVKVLKGLLRQMIDDWKAPRDKDERDIMFDCAAMSRLFSVGFIVMNRFAMSTHTVSHFWEPVKFLMSASNRTEEWPLYYAGSLPYDYRSHPIYEITLIGQHFSMMCASITYDATDSLFCAVTFHLIGQLSILKLKILNLNRQVGTDKFNDETFLRQFTYIQTMHTRLWR